MNEINKIKIYNYSDYRKYLSDYYDYMKETTSFFSHRYFINKAGLKSPNFLKNVIDNKKNLTEETIEKFSVALGLNKKEFEYFKNLVLFDQSKTSTKKQHYFERMKLFSIDVDKVEFSGSKISYFKNWYYPVVRELIVTRDYKNDWAKLANDIRPKISTSLVKKSVELLLKLDIIHENNDGTYSLIDKNITTGNSSMDVMVLRQYHKQTLENAIESIDTFDVHERTCSSLIMSLSEDTYQEIEDEIKEFRNRLTLIANKTKKSDRVYQVAIQMYPVSNIEDCK